MAELKFLYGFFLALLGDYFYFAVVAILAICIAGLIAGARKLF